MRLCCARLAAKKLIGRVACLLEELDVALEIGKSQKRNSRLPRAEKLSGAPDKKVLARDFEAVAVLIDHFEPRFRQLGHRLFEKQNADAFRSAASDATAQL